MLMHNLRLGEGWTNCGHCSTCSARFCTG